MLKKLNDHIHTKGNETYLSDDVIQLITENWSCIVKPVEYRTKTIISINNVLILRWIRNQIEILYENETLYKSNIIDKDASNITLSFAFSEGLIRIQGCKNNEGTFRLKKHISQFNPTYVFFHSSHILSIGEPETFSKKEALKNMTGLLYWFNPENSDIMLLPSENIQVSGSNCSLNDYIIFFAIEPYEYSSHIQDQSILKIETNNGYLEYLLSYIEEDITHTLEPEYIRRLYITQKVKINELSYVTNNFVDLFYKNSFIRNERPGPIILFLSTQSIHNNIATIRNYNYNNKWFIFDNIELNVKNITSNLDTYNITLGGTYHGKIKEIFFFNRSLLAEEAFDDLSIKWIMAYLKQKYAITDTLIKVK